MRRGRVVNMPVDTAEPIGVADLPTGLGHMKRAELGDVAEVRGRLARIIAINEGQRDITFEFVGGENCPTCGRPDRIDINEGCLNWQTWVRPVPTL